MTPQTRPELETALLKRGGLPQLVLLAGAVVLALVSIGCRSPSLSLSRSAAPAEPVPRPLVASERALGPVAKLDAAPAEVPVTSASHGRERCPDEMLPHAAAESVLTLRVHDVRTDRRELLPLDFSLALETTRRSGVEAAGTAGQRYVADLLVDVYSNPRLFRRLNAPRSEWAAGRLEARLVVRDALERRALCQVPLRVRGNAAGAPIRRRLRESTRAALETKLYRAANAEMRVALASISGVLRLAEPASAQVSSAQN